MDCILYMVIVLDIIWEWGESHIWSMTKGDSPSMGFMAMGRSFFLRDRMLGTVFGLLLTWAGGWRTAFRARTAFLLSFSLTLLLWSSFCIVEISCTFHRILSSFLPVEVQHRTHHQSWFMVQGVAWMLFSMVLHVTTLDFYNVFLLHYSIIVYLHYVYITVGKKRPLLRIRLLKCRGIRIRYLWVGRPWGCSPSWSVSEQPSASPESYICHSGLWFPYRPGESNSISIVLVVPRLP